MKKIMVRNGVFETNSSSTHSITMCNESDYIKWKNNELYFYEEENRFVTPKERKEIIRRNVFRSLFVNVDWKRNVIIYQDVDKQKEIAFENYGDMCAKVDALVTLDALDRVTDQDIADYEEKWVDGRFDIPCSYQDYYNNVSEEYETFKEEFVTPNNDKVISFGYYGNDY